MRMAIINNKITNVGEKLEPLCTGGDNEKWNSSMEIPQKTKDRTTK